MFPSPIGDIPLSTKIVEYARVSGNAFPSPIGDISLSPRLNQRVHFYYTEFPSPIGDIPLSTLSLSPRIFPSLVAPKTANFPFFSLIRNFKG